MSVIVPDLPVGFGPYFVKADPMMMRCFKPSATRKMGSMKRQGKSPGGAYALSIPCRSRGTS
jgi:hypothetical protein